MEIPSMAWQCSQKIEPIMTLSTSVQLVFPPVTNCMREEENLVVGGKRSGVECKIPSRTELLGRFNSSR